MLPCVCECLYPILLEVSTHLCRGYDFGYLVKLLSCMPLPTMEEDFFELLSIWFPTVFDVKYMMRTCKLRGGLQDGANVLEASLQRFLFASLVS